MAVSTITYTDKVDLNTTSVADINKVNASDLNEIKTVVNNNSTELGNIETYSTSETETGKIWIDGNSIYRKVYEIASLPNTTGISIDMNISNISQVVSLTGYTNTGLVFNGVRTNATSSQIDLYADTTREQIDVITYSDRTNLSGYIIIEYTKSS